MRAFDSGGGESVMEWCLGSSSLQQKWSLKVEHSQEATEVTGGLRRRAVLKMANSFLQQVVISTVHQESVMGEEVGPDERCDVGYDESPREIPA
jgi:hypothetical protein